MKTYNSCVYLLDTSVYSQPLRPRPLAAVERRWCAIPESDLAISVICELELLQGLHHKNSKRLWHAYNTLLKGRLRQIDITSNVVSIYAEQAARLRKQGKPRPQFDLLIAASALSHDLVLATCNPKDFQYIEGLKMEDWSI